MGFILDDAWERILPQMLRWQRNFRVSGAQFFKNTPEGATVGINPNVQAQGGRGTGDKTVCFKIYSQISGQVGRYQAKIFEMSVNDSASGALAEADIGTLPTDPNAIVWHVPEIALASAKHMLKTNVVYIGRKAGTNSNGDTIILMGAMPIGETASATTLGAASEGSESADSSTWSRATNGTPLDLYCISRVGYYHAGDEKLYGYARKLSFDAAGLLISASSETRVEIDAPDDCI